MQDMVYQAIKKLLQTHVKEWKGIKADGLGYVMARIEEFADDPDEAYSYAAK